MPGFVEACPVQVRVEFRDAEREDAHEEAQDPYAWMSDCDRWMVGKPADRACYDYIYRMQDRRDANARTLSVVYAASVVPFPLNLIFLILMSFRWRRR